MPELVIDRIELSASSSEILAKGGSICFQARGASMAPFIRDGDILTVQPVEASKLQVGDVIFYRAMGDRLAAHRLVGLHPQAGQIVLIARGDATYGSDEWVQTHNFLGKVVCLQRDGKTIWLDSHSQRALWFLWSRLYPLRRGFFPIWQYTLKIVLWSLFRLQSLYAYRYCAGLWLHRKTQYRMASEEDSYLLPRLYGHNNFQGLNTPGAPFAGHINDIPGAVDIWVAGVGEKLVGSAILKQIPHHHKTYPGWWITGMFVSPRYRGAGVGQGLLNQLLQAAAQKHAGQVRLLVFEDNTPALYLYRKAGFKPAPYPELDDQLQTEFKIEGRRRMIMSRSIPPQIQPSTATPVEPNLHQDE